MSNPDNWIGDEDEPLSGFSWKCGYKRDTTGIDIWNDAFLHTDTKTGEKIAIIVIDTQGLYDSETVPSDNLKILALGTLLSSILVLNVSDRIELKRLMHLKFAVDLGKYAALKNQNGSNKFFQNLLIMVRNWV